VREGPLNSNGNKINELDLATSSIGLVKEVDVLVTPSQ